MQIKNQIIWVALFLAMGNVSHARAESGGFTGTSYKATCRYPYPLETYQECVADTEAGEDAAECAENQAMGDCQNEHNSDCLVVSTRYQEVISTDFIGYKACEATVYVHGFREN